MHRIVFDLHIGKVSHARADAHADAHTHTHTHTHTHQPMKTNTQLVDVCALIGSLLDGRLYQQPNSWGT